MLQSICLNQHHFITELKNGQREPERGESSRKPDLRKQRREERVGFASNKTSASKLTTIIIIIKKKKKPPLREREREREPER